MSKPEIKHLTDTIISLESRIQELNVLLNRSKAREEVLINELSKNEEANKKRKIPEKPKLIIKRQKSFEDINKELSKIFAELNTIEDIIALSSLSDSAQYMVNPKFKKLYNTVPSLKLLNSMIGMSCVKKQLLTHINYFVQGLNNQKEMLHTVITGPPGCGKTELGSIIANIYLQIGLLNNNIVRKVSRKDLVAKYVGQTGPLTQKIIDSCDVLFIDEAYSLGDGTEEDSYGKEAADVLNQNLTEKAGKFVCIIAGYADKIEKCFFSLNEGLRRRFSYVYNIQEYTGIDLYNIFRKKVTEDNWLLDSSIAKELFEENKKYFVYFGGDVEKLWQYTKLHFSDRVAKTSLGVGDVGRLITKIDVNKAIKQLKGSMHSNESENNLMYV